MATGGNRVSTYRYAVGSLIVAACAWAGCVAQNAQPVAAGPATMPATAPAVAVATPTPPAGAGLGGGGLAGGGAGRGGPGAGAGRGGPGGGAGRGGLAGGIGAGPGGGRGRGAGGGAGAAPAGPPADVPPEVAIPHPTADEVARLNADLKQMMENDQGPDKDLLKKYGSLASFVMPRATNNAIVPFSGQPRAPRHQAFVDIANKGGFDILFEGDSITDWWGQNGPNAFKKYFGDSKVANFAVAGDTTQGLLWGLKNGEGQGAKPKAIMLMIGTNNTGQNTGAEIAEGVGADVLEMRKDFPDAKILLLAIFPRGTGPTDASRLKNEDANKIIVKLADNKHVFFMNINSKFLDDKGALIGFRTDNLHPQEKGYDIWGAAVADTLKGWVSANVMLERRD